MRPLLLTTVFAVLLFGDRGHGKVYDRCELARELQEIYKFPQEDIPKWLCLLYWESRYDTSALKNDNRDGSSNHGLFQINDKYWCQSTHTIPNTDVCQLPCDSLRDDNIYDDVNCVLQMFHRHSFNLWPSSFEKCAGNQTAWLTPCNTFHERSGYIQHIGYPPSKTYHVSKGAHYDHSGGIHKSGIKLTPSGIHINLSPGPLGALLKGGEAGLGGLLGSLTGKLRIKPFFKVYKTISLGGIH